MIGAAIEAPPGVLVQGHAASGACANGRVSFQLEVAGCGTQLAKRDGAFGGAHCLR